MKFKVGDVIFDKDSWTNEFTFTITDMNEYYYIGTIYNKNSGKKTLSCKYECNRSWILLSRKPVVSHLPEYL